MPLPLSTTKIGRLSLAVLRSLPGRACHDDDDEGRVPGGAESAEEGPARPHCARAF